MFMLTSEKKGELEREGERVFVREGERKRERELERERGLLNNFSLIYGWS